jgi:hypothetical protein
MHEHACPGCGTTNDLHEIDCKHEGTSRAEIEKAHTDILAKLSLSPHEPDTLRQETHGEWDALHEAVLDSLKRSQRVQLNYVSENDLFDVASAEEDKLVLLTPGEWREERVPTEPYIREVWSRGPVDGAKDAAIVAAISWHEWAGFSWEETTERVADWLQETGAWERGSWEESSIEELLSDKRHVHEEGYGWAEKAKQAAGVGRTT